MMQKVVKLKISKYIKRILLTTSICIVFESATQSQEADTMLLQYFNKSISHISKDIFDTLDLRYIIFELINNKIVANDHQDVINIFGKPIHTHHDNDGSKFLIYPLAYTKSMKYGSMLLILEIDSNQNIIKRSGTIYFLETD
jgi:hypothetical protein